MAGERTGTRLRADAEAPGAAHQPVKSAARTVEVLEYLAHAGGMHSLRDLQKVLGHPKSSLHALLRTLVDAGWVECDQTGTLYGMGLRALLVGMAYIDGDEMVALAGSTLTWLAQESTETIHLARLDRSDVVYLATRDSRHELRVISRVGHRLPAHATALGKALLARYGDDELRALLPKRLDALTPYTITDRERLLADLEATRQRGYAIDREENTIGLQCLGVAIDHRQPVRDAISCSVPCSRMTTAREATILELLMVARERIVREGWSLSPIRSAGTSSDEKGVL